MDEKLDVLIVGAGILGAAAAFELSKRGQRTLNVEKLSDAGNRFDLQLLRDHPHPLLDA